MILTLILTQIEEFFVVAPVKKGKKKAVKSRKAGGEKLPSLSHSATQYESYRDGYRALRSLVFIQSIFILIFLMAIMYFFNTYKAKRVHFATTNSGKLIPLVALDRPNLTGPSLMSWVSIVSSEVLTFGFSDYRPRLNEASRHFTRIGWESFADALEKAEYMKMVESEQMVVTAIPREAPVVISEGPINGRYQWEISLAMNVTFHAGSKEDSQVKRIRITVVRVPYLESPNGIGIERWIQK